MGSNSGRFENLRDKCNTISNTLFEMKVHIHDTYKRKYLVRDLITQIRACRDEVDRLLRENFNAETNQNLRDIKETLCSDDFIDLNESLDVSEMKVLLNSAITHIKEVSNCIDQITSINSLMNKLKSLWSVFGSFLGKSIGMISTVAMKAIKYV
jgi:hypothetical protein